MKSNQLCRPHTSEQKIYNKAMKKAQISLIMTVLNEADTIQLLLQAITKQTLLPNEVIIVDGGSQDQTVVIIEKFINNLPLSSQKKLNFTLKKLPNSNRSQARNWAIKHSQHDLIAITDAGCIPQPNWLKNLVASYQASPADIVGGYFYGLPATAFEQAVVAYTLITPGKLNPDHFMPTTRSVLMQKSAWKKLNGFDETLALNEDFEFFYRAKKLQLKFNFAQDALVAWLPRKNLKEFSTMIFRFAQGDIQSGILRPKVVLVFGRYLLALLAILGLLSFTPVAIERLVMIIGFWLVIYLVWAIQKNLEAVPQGWYWLPALQITADLAVMTGSLIGLGSYKRNKQ